MTHSDLFKLTLPGLMAIGLFILPAPAGATNFKVDPEKGNSSMTATFSAPLGERITAVSTAVSCDLDFTDTGEATGKCSLPLTSISVDNEPDKTDHFQQWATNKKSDPAECAFEFDIENAKTTDLVKPRMPIQMRAVGTFTICGRKHAKGARENLRGGVVLFPAGERGPGRVVKISATIEGFNRDDYKIGPDYTSGWLARVQKLADVVGHEGTIELNLFAYETAK